VTDGASAFTINNPDQNNRSFRSNVVLRWEWRPGSLLFLVWQQNRATPFPSGANVVGDRAGVGDLFSSLSEVGDNIFAVKMTLWRSR
jgi:hypothetical protein